MMSSREHAERFATLIYIGLARRQKAPHVKMTTTAWLGLAARRIRISPTAPPSPPPQTYGQTHNGLYYTTQHNNGSEEERRLFLFFNQRIGEENKCEDEVLYGIFSGSLCNIPCWVS